MADVITRFKLETTQFDSKLRDESRRLTDLTKHLQLAGNDFNKFAANSVESARALGQLSTGTYNAAQSLKVLVKAYNDVANAYNALTEEQKKGDFGKAMAESLQQLQGRITQTKNELNGSNGLTGALDAVAQKFGLNIKQLGTLGGALAVGKVAWEGIQRTMQSTEATADAVASAQLQLNTAVDSFFRSIAEGNFSNFLNGLSDVARRAREAYEAMDELGSFATRFNPRNQADMQKIDALLREARALMAKGDKAGAAAKTEEAKRVADQAAANTRAYGEREYAAGMSTLRNLLGKSGVNFTDAQIAYYSDPKNWEETQQRAEKYAATLRELRQAEANLAGIGQSGNQKMINAANERYNNALAAFNSLSARDRRAYAYINTPDSPGTANGDAFVAATQRIYGRQNAQTAVDAIYARIERADAMANRPTGSGGGGGNTKTELDVMQKAQARISELTKEAYTADADRQKAIKQEVAELQKQIAAYKAIEDDIKGITKETKAPERGVGIGITSDAGLSAYVNALKQELSQADLGSALYQSLAEQLADATTLQNLVKESLAQGLGTAMFDVADETGKDFWTRAMEGGVENIDWDSIVAKINEARKAAGLDAIQIDFKTGNVKTAAKEVAKDGDDAAHNWRAAASAIQSVGSALSNIEDPAAKVAGLIAQAIAQVAATFAASLKGTFTPWDWIAGAAAGTATMISTIAAIKSATAGSYAEGGIVPGRSFTGDNLTANVNSGELILTAAQQNNIASLLSGGSQQGGGTTTATVSSENIRIAIRNGARARGLTVNEYINL